jgi:hypothetical protein
MSPFKLDLVVAFEGLQNIEYHDSKSSTTGNEKKLEILFLICHLKL